MSLSGMDPDVLEALRELRRLAQAYGVSYTITSAYRTHVAQRRLYLAWLARGRTGLPAAAPGTSTHEYGVAFDAVTNQLGALVQLATAVGFVWAGGGDPVHFDAFGAGPWRTLLQSNGISG